MNQTGGSESHLSSHSGFTEPECRLCSECGGRNSYFFSAGKTIAVLLLLSVLITVIFTVSTHTDDKPTEESSHTGRRVWKYILGDVGLGLHKADRKFKK